MPVFKYVCPDCGKTHRKIHAIRKESYACDCGGVAVPELPTTTNSVTYETRDSRRGKQTRKGIDQQLTKRMRDHHNKYEIEEKIDKFGLDEAKKHGWDKKIKKV